MKIIPSIELKYRRAVLTNPDAKKMKDKINFQQPMPIVENWINSGADVIHMIDIDSFMTKQPEHTDMVSTMRAAHQDTKIHVSAAIRDIESAWIWLDAGADAIILGQQALKRKILLHELCQECPSQILVSLDETLSGKKHQKSMLEKAEECANAGVGGIILTACDAENGHPSLKNLIAAEEVGAKFDLPTYANGGAYTIDDIKTLSQHELPHVPGVIIGHPLSDGRINFSKAMKILDI